MYKFRSMEKYTAGKSLDLWNVELKKHFLHWLALETGNSRRAFSSKDQSAHSLCPTSMSAVMMSLCEGDDSGRKLPVFVLAAGGELPVDRSSTVSFDPAERGSDKWSQPGRGYLSLPILDNQLFGLFTAWTSHSIWSDLKPMAETFRLIRKVFADVKGKRFSTDLHKPAESAHWFVRVDFTVTAHGSRS